ncbi:uncharacterized protein LOC144803374 isoform X1 [Lissotriton helveticus]
MRGTYWLKGPFWRRIIEGPLHQQNQVLWDRPPNAAANLRGTKKRVSFRILSEECDKFFATRYSGTDHAMRLPSSKEQKKVSVRILSEECAEFCATRLLKHEQI